MAPPLIPMLSKKVFFRRMLRPAIGVYFIGFLIMGALVTAKVLVVQTDSTLSGDLIEAARAQYAQLLYDFQAIPSWCLNGEIVNDLQVKRCDERRWSILVHLIWTVFPFLFTFVVLGWGYDIVRSVYRLANKRLLSGKNTFLAVATDPAMVPNDLYGWFHVCTSVTVELPSRVQVRVYVPYGVQPPGPGQKVAVADLGKRFGAKRQIGIPYLPHVLVT